jgi:hypothetical protein
MQPQTLLDTIRGAPKELKLFETIRFRRRTRSSTCDFQTILQALTACDSLTVLICSRHFMSGITSDEWFRFLQCTGSIPNLRELYFVCHSRVPVLAIAHIVGTSKSLRKLFFGHDNTLTGNVTELRDLVTGQGAVTTGTVTATATATVAGSGTCTSTSASTSDSTDSGNNDNDIDNDIKSNNCGCYFRHSALEELIWLGGANDDDDNDNDGDNDRSNQQEPLVPFDALLRALIPCPKLRTAKIGTERIPEDSLRALLASSAFQSLHMLATMDEWMVVSHCLQAQTACLTELVLSSHFTKADTDTAISSLAKALGRDPHLLRLRLEMCNGYTDTAGVALAEAMQMNTALQHVDLDENGGCGEASGDTRNSMGVTAYKALTAMAVVRSDLRLGVPVVDEHASVTDKEQHAKLRIELRLNAVGRRQLLVTSPTTREAWVNALLQLNADRCPEDRDIKVDCLFTFLLLNPTVCHLDNTAVRRGD